MKFRVLSVAIDTTTVPLSLVPPFSLEAPREEVIDSQSNEGFTHCQTSGMLKLPTNGFGISSVATMQCMTQGRR